MTICTKVRRKTKLNPSKLTNLKLVIIIGDSGVGKTSFLSRYIKGIFPLSPFPTIAIEFATKIIQIKEGGYIKAQIWDTAGQEKYKSITMHHYRRAVGAIIVYDVTKKSSFENVGVWLNDLRNFAEKNVVVALIGNKIDLVEKNIRKREVSFDEGQSFAKENNLLFFETSACNNIKVNETFEDLLQCIYTERRKLSNIKLNKPPTLLTIENAKKESSCCNFK